MTLIRPLRTARHRASGVESAAAGDPGDAFPETRPMPPVRPDSWAGDFYGDEDAARGEMFPGERVAMTVAAVTVVVLVATIIVAQVTIALGWVWALGLCVFAGACALLWAMSEAVHR